MGSGLSESRGETGREGDGQDHRHGQGGEERGEKGAGCATLLHGGVDFEERWSNCRRRSLNAGGSARHIARLYNLNPGGDFLVDSRAMATCRHLSEYERTPDSERGVGFARLQPMRGSGVSTFMPLRLTANGRKHA